MKRPERVGDTVGVQDGQPPPQVSSAAVTKRKRARQERTSKIEALPVTRVSGPSKPAPQALVFEVVRHRGHWRISHNGKRSAPLADQTAAILAAKKLAREKSAEGHSVEVILRRTDGDSVPQSIDTDECCSKA